MRLIHASGNLSPVQLDTWLLKIDPCSSISPAAFTEQGCGPRFIFGARFFDNSEPYAGDGVAVKRHEAQTVFSVLRCERRATVITMAWTLCCVMAIQTSQSRVAGDYTMYYESDVSLFLSHTCSSPDDHKPSVTWYVSSPGLLNRTIFGRIEAPSCLCVLAP